MKKIGYLKQGLILSVTLVTIFAFYSQSSENASATTAQTLLESRIAFTAASQVGVVGGARYGPGGAWCGDFVSWVLTQNGIHPHGGGRGAFNHRIANAWGVFGPRGGGYGRPATRLDPMPGDILVDRFNGTASTGGHVSIVIETFLMGQAHLVRTIGGNESNSVRNQVKDLRQSSRYLVTLSELRNQHIPLSTGGTVVVTRFQSGFGTVAAVHSIWDTQRGRVVTSGNLNGSGYLLRARDWHGRLHTFQASQPMSSIAYRHIELHRMESLSSTTRIAVITHN